MYRLSTFYVAKTGVEMLSDTILPPIFSATIYYVVGLNPDKRGLLLFLMLSVVDFVQKQGIGMVVSACFMDTCKALAGKRLYVIVALVLCGYIINPGNVTAVVRPLVYGSIVKDRYVGFVQNEVAFGRELACSGDDVITTVYSGT